MADADYIIRRANEEREYVHSILPDAAEFFHRYEGKMFEREEAVEELMDELEVEERVANRLIAGLVADEVDPIVQVRVGNEKHVGIIDYEEHGFYYSYTDWDDVDEDREIGVCVQCVKEEEFDQDVFRVGDADEKVMREHLEGEHGKEPAEVETGATLLSGTTVAGNTVYHTANDGPNSGLNADLLDGVHASEFLHVINTQSSIFEYSHADGNYGQKFHEVSTTFSPRGLSIDSADSIWATESSSITKLDQDGNEISVFASPDSDTRDLGVDSSGCIWVAGGSGSPGSIYRADQSISNVSSYNSPDSLWAMTVDNNDSLWFGENSILKANQNVSIISCFTKPSSPSIVGMGVDSSNSLWMLGSDSTIYKTDQSVTVLDSFSNPSQASLGLTMGIQDQVWVGGSNKIKKFAVESNWVWAET